MAATELSQILDISRVHNQRDGVSGLLIYKYPAKDNRANLMQLLEGSEEAVKRTYARIADDPRHHTKIVLEPR